MARVLTSSSTGCTRQNSTWLALRSFARLFIAIRLTEEFKRPLIEAQEQLRERGVTGNFTTADNLHLTLAFIGETECVEEIKRIVSGVRFEPFEIETAGLGCFEPTRILWMGTTAEDKLTAIANELRSRLVESGIPFTALAFKSHITLVKKPSRFLTDITVPSAKMLVEHISVMESVNGNGRLVYEER